MPKQAHLSPEKHKREPKPKRARQPVGTESADSESRQSAEKPISLQPLKFEEAVRDLLKVKADNGRKKQQHRSRS